MKCNKWGLKEGFEVFVGGGIVQFFSRSVIESFLVGVYLFGAPLGKVLLFGQILADELIVVLVGPSLPGMVRMGKVELRV